MSHIVENEHYLHISRFFSIRVKAHFITQHNILIYLFILI